MPVYTYQAKKGPSEVIQGQIEAPTKEEAISKISTSGLFLIDVAEKKTSKRETTKVSLKQLVEFTHQLSTLINSGSPLLTSLNTLVSQTDQAKLRPILLDVVAQVKDGQDFSYALEQHSKIFPRLYSSLVKIGEASGTLGQNLNRLAEFLEEEMDFRSSMVSALTYPSLIILVGILTVVALLRFVIPKLVGVFQELGQALPLPTLFLVNLSDFVTRYGSFILIAFGFLIFSGKKYLGKPQNKFNWDRTKLKIPLLGELLQKIQICSFSRTLAILLRNGVPVDNSLRVLANTVSNSFIQKEISKLEEAIAQGTSLSEAMKASPVFVPAFINVVTVGEDSGSLDTVLENLAIDYNKEINRKIKNLMSLLEPLLILGVGLIVGFVVLSMLLPIFSIDFNF